MRMPRKLKSFYVKNKIWVWIAVGIVAIFVALTLTGFTFGVFGGWSRKPI